MSSINEAAHQPREHRVPCALCSEKTANVHAICAECYFNVRPAGLDAMCGKCCLDPIRAVWPETADELVVAGIGGTE